MKRNNCGHQYAEVNRYNTSRKTSNNRWFLPAILLFSLLLLCGCFGIFYGLKYSKKSTKTVMVTVKSCDNTMGTVLGEGEYAKSTTITIEAVPNKYYRFVKWSDGNKECKREVVVNNDCEYMAFFEAKPLPIFDVRAISSDSLWGKVSGGGIYDSLAVVTIKANANDGYQFDSWDDGNKEVSRKVLVRCNQTYVAIFKPNKSKVEPLEKTGKEKVYYNFGWYEGDLNNGIPEGSGVCYYTCSIQIAKHDSENTPHYAESGDWFEGTWGNGDIISGTLYSKDGMIKEKILAPKRFNPYDLHREKCQ